MMTDTGLILVTVNTPLLAATAAVGLLGTAAFWLWFFFLRRSKPAPQSPPLAWELIPDSPAGSDLFISDKVLELRSNEYRFLGNMPANFLCERCGTPENIELKLYHYLPNNCMVIITRHKCGKLDERQRQLAARDTIQIPTPMVRGRRNVPQIPPAF